MKIAYYMPFKPLGHPNPSGDLVTGTELHAHLTSRGHDCRLISDFRCRWIYLRPFTWFALLKEQQRSRKVCSRFKPDVWLTYHSYYKAPDLIGPGTAAKLHIPYVIFQGIYSTKRRKKLKTLPGFYLNRYALTRSDLVFTNKKRDKKNLLRLLPEHRICYIPPGIHTSQFTFSRDARKNARQQWNINNETVILTAAMFRPGVKTRGVQEVIQSCAELVRRGRDIKLVIAGDGKNRTELESIARRLLPDRTIFCGKVPRNSLFQIYSGADIFAFPGIEESLGMVYLEAQSCGLPVAAYENWGGGEAVIHEKTGLLSSVEAPQTFTDNIDRLITDRQRRREFGRRGALHVRRQHELQTGYSLLDEKLSEITHNSGG